MFTPPCLRILALALVLTWTEGRGAIEPTPETGQIARLVGRILSCDNYRHLPLDNDVSRRFLQNYLETLDRNRLFFLDADIREFEARYGATMDDATLGANIEPGVEIFNRYLRRVEERVTLANELLKEKFSFNTEEILVRNREEAPWPTSEAEARQIWRQWVKFELLQERLARKKPEDITKTVSRRYANLLRNVREEYDLDTMLQLYLTALAHVYDPHSEYLPPSELENFDIHMKLSLCGIGAVLKSEDGYVKVVEIIRGGPASSDKRLKINDRIVGVAQGDGPVVDVVGMKLSKTVALIRGEKNTIVRLLVIPAESLDEAARVEIRLKRDDVKLSEQEAKARLIDRKDARNQSHRLGYITLPSFYADMQQGAKGKSTTHDVRMLLEKLKAEAIEGLVLDLRHNPGGSLAEAVALTALFIPQGPVVQIKDVRGRVQIMDDERSSCVYDGPLVVLVDHLSASASEILAAALQDYGRAVIIGDEKTFGKGTVQKVEDLGRFLNLPRERPARGGALKITTQKFYRVTGGSTEGRGVLPDIHLPSVYDVSKIAESSLKNTFPYDEITPASYQPVDRVNPYLSRLRNASRDRVARDPEFAYVREDMQRLKAKLEEKTVSLSEAHWTKELKDDKEREAKRDKERAARKGENLQVADITLDQIKEPPVFHAPAASKSARPAKPPSDPEDEPPAGENPSGRAVFQEALRILADLIDHSPARPK